MTPLSELADHESFMSRNRRRRGGPPSASSSTFERPAIDTQHRSRGSRAAASRPGQAALGVRMDHSPHTRARCQARRPDGSTHPGHPSGLSGRRAPSGDTSPSGSQCGTHTSGGERTGPWNCSAEDARTVSLARHFTSAAQAGVERRLPDRVIRRHRCACPRSSGTHEMPPSPRQ